MEFFDVYNSDRTKTGFKCERGKEPPSGGYRLVVHICIFNSKGEMLIQKRQPVKHAFPDMWDLSAGGSVISGETSAEGAQRETLEELGLKTDLSQKTPHLTFCCENIFDDYYIINRDIDLDELILQESEVSEVKWADLEEIIEIMKKGVFVPYKEGLIKLLFELKDSRGAR
ncbi:MAG: NUDIX domain-containing protein [Clostridiales bacterium]|nr:NUDIX domain-containing protein [Clostridiales bacterium]